MEKLCDKKEHDENTTSCAYCKQIAESNTLKEGK